MEFIDNRTSEHLVGLFILWQGLGCFLILYLNIWNISAYFRLIEKAGFYKAALLGLVCAITFWPIAVFVTMPFMAWANKQAKKQHDITKENLRALLHKRS
jgi:hypothetical protein